MTYMIYRPPRTERRFRHQPVRIRPVTTIPQSWDRFAMRGFSALGAGADKQKMLQDLGEMIATVETAITAGINFQDYLLNTYKGQCTVNGPLSWFKDLLHLNQSECDLINSLRNSAFKAMKDLHKEKKKFLELQARAQAEGLQGFGIVVVTAIAIVAISVAVVSIAATFYHHATVSLEKLKAQTRSDEIRARTEAFQKILDDSRLAVEQKQQLIQSYSSAIAPSIQPAETGSTGTGFNWIKWLLIGFVLLLVITVVLKIKAFIGSEEPSGIKKG